jgi:hypothetical protein
MPRKSKPVAEATELGALRTRIRDAEKKYVPLARESIGIDAEGYETLALLVERGMGKPQDMLRQALATGLRVLEAGSKPATLVELVNATSVLFEGPPPPDPHAAQRLLDERRETQPSIIDVPLSQRRVDEDEEEEEGHETA